MSVSTGGGDTRPRSRSPQQVINIHGLLRGIPSQQPASEASICRVYLLNVEQGIVFKAAQPHIDAIAAATREQTIYSLISSGLLKLPQTLRHYHSFPNHGTFMSYLPNGTLYSRILDEERSPLPTPPLPNQIRTRIQWMIQLLRLARAFARRDLDHGDWHPRNLVFDDNDQLNVIDFSSVVQFGTRIWKPGSPAYNYHLHPSELNGSSASPWSHDQSWWKNARQRWSKEVFPKEFGLDTLLNSYQDAERPSPIFATERRTCFSLACILYFIMSGHEPHPIMFAERRAQGHTISRNRTPSQSPLDQEINILPDPEDARFEPYGMLGSIIRACWQGRVASVVVLTSSLIRNVSVHYASSMGWDMIVSREAFGTYADEMPVFNQTEYQAKKKICESYVLDWARAHQAAQGKM